AQAGGTSASVGADARPEPDGPADSIPDDTASPGATYQSTGSTSGWADDQDGAAWVSSIADVITAGLKTASDQINDALKTVGVTTSDWSQKVQDTLNDARVWDISIERARRKARISFAASDLRNADFRGQQLADSSFAGSSMRGADFTGAILTGSSFKASDLRGVIFNQANLTDAKLTTASLRDAQFEGANLTGAVLSYASMRGIAFIGCAMGGVRAKYSDLRGVRFADVTMESVDFTGSDLRDASFDGLIVTNCRFDFSNPRDASFRGAVLRGCSFHHVSARAISTLICDDTVVDAATYASLQSTGAVPLGLRVEG
ncbi:MAG: pentapeptide repeat-containing protein, partial [Propionibacteriaceae bacterium]|nr:pentapeptide repeat-containing protein [Propionibacteriaceae bacterium]